MIHNIISENSYSNLQQTYQSNMSNDAQLNAQLNQPITPQKNNTVSIIIISVAILLVLAIIIWIITDCIHTNRLIASFNQDTITKLISDKLYDLVTNNVDAMPYQLVIYEIIDSIPTYSSNSTLKTIQQNIILRLCYELCMNDSTRVEIGNQYKLNYQLLFDNNKISKDIKNIYAPNQLKLLKDKYNLEIKDTIEMINKLRQDNQDNNNQDNKQDIFGKYKNALNTNVLLSLKNYTDQHRDSIGIIKTIISNSTFQKQSVISENVLSIVLNKNLQTNFLNILQYVIVPVLILIIVGLIIIMIILIKNEE